MGMGVDQGRQHHVRPQLDRDRAGRHDGVEGTNPDHAPGVHVDAAGTQGWTGDRQDPVGDVTSHI